MSMLEAIKQQRIERGRLLARDYVERGVLHFAYLNFDDEQLLREAGAELKCQKLTPLTMSKPMKEGGDVEVKNVEEWMTSAAA